MAIASAVSAWRGRPIRAEVLATLSAVFLLAALLRPSILGGASRVWGRVGHVLAWINSRILLTLLFFLVLTPLGFLARLFGSDPLGARVAAHWERFPERLQRPNHYEHWF